MRLSREWSFLVVLLVAAAVWSGMPRPADPAPPAAEPCATLAQADRLCLQSPAEAVPLYEQALRDGCGDEGLAIGYALSLARLGRLEEAVQVQAEALALPRTPETAQLLRNNLAWDLFLLKRPAEGLRHVEVALSLAPAEPCTLDTRGALMAQLGQWEAAAADFRRAVQTEPQVGLFHAHLAVALHQQGDAAGAAREREIAGRLERQHLEGNQFCHLCQAFEALDPRAATAHFGCGDP